MALETSIIGENPFFLPTGPFNYKFNYDLEEDTLEIISEHTKEFFKWVLKIDQPFKSSPGAELGYNLSPKHLFKILSDFKNGKINQYLKVEIEDKFNEGDEQEDIEIQITIFATYDTNLSDKKILVLEAEPISSEQRLIKKYNKNEEQMNVMRNEIDSLKIALKHAQNDINSLKSSLRDVIDIVDGLGKKPSHSEGIINN